MKNPLIIIGIVVLVVAGIIHVIIFLENIKKWFADICAGIFGGLINPRK